MSLVESKTTSEECFSEANLELEVVVSPSLNGLTDNKFCHHEGCGGRGRRGGGAARPVARVPVAAPARHVTKSDDRGRLGRREPAPVAAQAAWAPAGSVRARLRVREARALPPRRARAPAPAAFRARPARAQIQSKCLRNQYCHLSREGLTLGSLQPTPARVGHFVIKCGCASNLNRHGTEFGAMQGTPIKFARLRQAGSVRSDNCFADAIATALRQTKPDITLHRDRRQL
ncbi:hypothetical protein EVAR_7692_1 [Eumeta japonica]|uniref:Uncharacterized protein n=1 Tax=Eumeta variegata TaxID=151549 RepID=A0A4C1TIE5_EUMVA|nr:hypothetical protein EVAR_7692_1 [Eumeta japonica]